MITVDYTTSPNRHAEASTLYANGHLSEYTAGSQPDLMQ